MSTSIALDYHVESRMLQLSACSNVDELIAAATVIGGQINLIEAEIHAIDKKHSVRQLEGYRADRRRRQMLVALMDSYLATFKRYGRWINEWRAKHGHAFDDGDG